MDKTRIAYLVGVFFEGALTIEEKEELAGWISQAGDDETLRSVLEDAWFRYEPGDDVVAMASPFMDRLQERMFPAHGHRLSGPDVELVIDGRRGPDVELVAGQESGAGAPVVPLPWYRRRWKSLAAAAILLLIVTGVVLWRDRPVSAGVTQAQPGEPRTAQAQDAKPGGSKAMLTLGDGSHITLDSAGIGELAKQGDVVVQKSSSDRIAYNGAGSAPTPNAPVAYNTLSTPRGGRYQLTLPDGTIVWLNASSSITYPVAFTGDKRKVSVTGESYFEVHSDPAHPFVVSKGGVDVTVLGTEFNVNAYDEEEQMRVTLVQGSVKVDKGGKGVQLRPGQQAQVPSQTGIQDQAGRPGQAGKQGSGSTQVRLASQVNVSAVTAWKNGSFDFDGKTLPEILRQLSRWYDVDVVYQGPVRHVNIAGAMGMDLNLSQVLKVLQKTGVDAHVEGKNLIILP